MTDRKAILVVEDDPALRKLFSTALAQAGFAVREAPNGYEAIHSVERNPPDLIVLDLLLPGFGGLSVQQEIAERASTKLIPIVIVTGSTRALDHLAVACVLRKPVDPDALVETVKKCLEPERRTITLGELIVFTPFGSTRPETPSGQVWQSDRGNREGQYMVTWTGGPKDTRPVDAKGSNTAPSEYQLLSPGTVGPLPEVDVLGIHFIKVRPDRRDAFERYVNDTLHPAVGNLRPDLRLLYYKAVRGPDEGDYLAIFALTKASRDKYWPGGVDSDELRAAFKPVSAHTTELLTYLVDGSALTDDQFAAAVYESRDWADFVLLTPGA